MDRTFSDTEKYKNLNQQWGNLIIIKGQELSKYLTGKRKTLSFSSPKVQMERVDSVNLREKIRNLSYTEWQKMGFSKGTLHYMKQNVKGNKPFTLNRQVKERIEGMM